MPARLRRARAAGPARLRAPGGRDDEERLTADTVALARQYGRYGYRKVTALLRAEGWAELAKILCGWAAAGS